MRPFLLLIGLLFYSFVNAQELKIGEVTNRIQLGELAGNRDLAFGVKNILEEVIQDYGYDLNPNSSSVLTVDILFFDVMKNSVQLGVYGKNIDVYQLAATATFYIDGKKKKTVSAKATAKSISTATLIIDQGGKFSQANVSTAMKKLCEQLVEKLKL